MRSSGCRRSIWHWWNIVALVFRRRRLLRHRMLIWLRGRISSWWCRSIRLWNTSLLDTMLNWKPREGGRKRRNLGLRWRCWRGFWRNLGFVRGRGGLGFGMGSFEVCAGYSFWLEGPNKIMHCLMVRCRRWNSMVYKEKTAQKTIKCSKE